MYCERCGKYSGRYPLCKECYYEDEENVCEICGKESGEYPLCKICFQKVKEYAEEHYYDSYDNDEIDYEDEYEYESYSPCVCITCNKPKENNDFFFCSDCYKKYHNKELILSVIKAKEIKILESRYYNKYKCDDGHYVKSKSEREIDNFLNKYQIRHYYEPELSIDGKVENSIHPDFYLPSLDIYIEHWGKDNDRRYKESMEYKIDIYKKLKVTLICTYENEDTEDIEGSLKRKLKYYKKGSINYLKE